MFSFLVALLLVEVGLRLLGIRFDASFYVYDPTLAWALRPGAAGWSVSEGDTYVRINSEGQRDIERSIEKPPGTFRVAVLGDSMVESRQVSLDETYCMLTEKALPRCPAMAGQRVEVLNFGVNGYGTAQEFLLLTTRVWKYRPDLVLLVFYPGNDLFDNSRPLDYAAQGLRPYFVFRGDELVLDDSFRQDRYFRPASVLRHRVISEVISWSRLLQLLNTFNERRYNGRVRQKQQNAGGGVPSNYSSTWPFLKPEHPYLLEAWRVTEALLLRVRDEARAHQADFALVCMPTPLQIAPDRQVRQAFLEKLGTDTLSYADMRLKNFGEQNHMPVLLLSVPLGEQALREGTYLNGFRKSGLGEGHLNLRGHQVAAEALTRFLCDRRRAGQEAARGHN